MIRSTVAMKYFGGWWNALGASGQVSSLLGWLETADEGGKNRI